MGRTYKDKLKEEVAMKHYYDGWTARGLEEKLKRLEESDKKMTLNEFAEHQATWLNRFHEMRLMDIDFEMYILMQTDLNKEEFLRMMKRLDESNLKK
jgi:hypothetical protein